MSYDYEMIVRVSNYGENEYMAALGLFDSAHQDLLYSTLDDLNREVKESFDVYLSKRSGTSDWGQCPVHGDEPTGLPDECSCDSYEPMENWANRHGHVCYMAVAISDEEALAWMEMGVDVAGSDSSDQLQSRF